MRDQREREKPNFLFEKEKLGKPVLFVLHPVWNFRKEHEYGIE